MRPGRKPSLRCVNKIESSAREIGSSYISQLQPPPLSPLEIQTAPQGRSAGKLPLLFRCSRKVWRRCDGGPTVHPVQRTSVSTLSPPTRCTPSILLVNSSSLHLAIVRCQVFRLVLRAYCRTNCFEGRIFFYRGIHLLKSGKKLQLVMENILNKNIRKFGKFPLIFCLRNAFILITK